MKNPALFIPLVAFVWGCGPSGQRFHGTYALTGSAHYSIKDFGNFSSQLAESFRVSEGTRSDLVFSDAGGTCLLPANVEGEVATLEPGATCTRSDGDRTITVTLTRGTASLAGEVVRFDLSGSATVLAHGTLYAGSFFQRSTLTRTQEVDR
jgi:hypothetical protein